ncbi:Na+/H+ antiporter subunit E [Pseudothauera nasutitermitis]|uniref:Na+/H+ antiporter subunit E n=1 Tax=Pseudothauera nasutitermitis TaxID=2565930 RepID=A0A4S4AQ63_9RHOO|nr:Na+/H+ antiporter subunit E [Pseudothauera nasutitermitis]THF61875.1 Na+/H+ antiporter subunit E [Pseudothauera nasutitermitis]
MKRWLPSPWLSLVLFLTWLLLNQTVHPAHLLLGGLLAIGIPVLARPLRPLVPTPLRNPGALLRLAVMSFIEIVRSCFNVSGIILFGGKAGVNSQFIRIPLDLRDPYGLALLSCLINSTPGTVWVEILPDSDELALHVFDLHDEQWWVDTIKTRYEGPIMEIFEGGRR